jgi:hypothetical protein
VTASTPHWSERLVELNACSGSIQWAHTQPSYEDAWEACERGDWLLWLATRLATDRGRLRVEDRRHVVLATCAVARTALHLIPQGEDRPRLAIETAEAWAKGAVEIEDVRHAARAAYYAYVNARTTDTLYATSAADAACTAATSVYVFAVFAADVAYTAAYATAEATTNKSATLVRSMIARPKWPELAERQHERTE